MNNLDNIKKFIELRSLGFSLRDISDKIGISKTSLVKWNKKYCNIVFEVQSEEMKKLKNKILEDKLSRLEYLSDKYSKLKIKIDKSEIIMRYDKMLLLLLKISKSIDECQKNIILTEFSGNIDEAEKTELLNEILLEENNENNSDSKQV